jgi:drug/metabolite transporter (DMT)-like permease
MPAKVRVSPISKAAAILILAVGLFTLIAGLSTGIVANSIAGGAITVLGMVLYALLYRFNRRLERELGEADSSTSPQTGRS